MSVEVRGIMRRKSYGTFCCYTQDRYFRQDDIFTHSSANYVATNPKNITTHRIIRYEQRFVTLLFSVLQKQPATQVQININLDEQILDNCTGHDILFMI